MKPLSTIPVWSKNSSRLAVSKKLKFFNGDEFIEGTGEKKKEEEVKEDEYSYSERTHGKFSRTLSLPCKVKSDKGKATFKDGILEVRIPKTEEAKKRHIKIKIE